MKRFKLLLLVLTLILTLHSQASLGGISDLINIASKAKETADSAAHAAKGASGLSLEEEIAIGDAVAVVIVTRYGGVWRDEAATHRVNLIGQLLAQYASRQDLTWRFGLLDSDAINAFSAPGGRVFITRGLYELPLDDHQLAGVLAHEIIHIDNRHAVDIIARGELLAGVSELVADNNSSYAAFDSVVGNATEVIIVKGFDPGTEYDADEGGRSLAAVTGYAPGGLRSVLVSIDELDDQSNEVFSTHPSNEKRLKRLPNDPPPPVADEDAVALN